MAPAPVAYVQYPHQPQVVYVQQAPSPPRSTKSKSTAALLAILLGGIGAHKFYLGQPMQGLIYLLFCLTGIPMIIGFFEGICYLTYSDEKFDRDFPG